MTNPADFFTDEQGIRRDRWGRPQLPHPETGELRYWTRVSTFAKSVSDTYNLGQWAQRMVAKGLAMRHDLYALAASTPLEDYKTLNKLAEEAKEAAGSKAKANTGSALHKFAEQVDSGELAVADVPEPWRSDIEAYLAALKLHRVDIRSSLIERLVVTPEVEAAGSFDRIVYHDGAYKIADMKTGNIQYSMMEIAVQLAVYANATGMWDPGSKSMWPAQPGVSLTHGLVFHLPAGEARCDIYDVDLKLGWEVAQLAYEVRKRRSSKAYLRLAAPPSTEETLKDIVNPTPPKAPRKRAAPKGGYAAGTKPVAEMTPPPASVAKVGMSEAALERYQHWTSEIALAASREELREIWALATSLGEWTPVLKAAGDKRIKELGESKV